MGERNVGKIRKISVEKTYVCSESQVKGKRGFV